MCACAESSVSKVSQVISDPPYKAGKLQPGFFHQTVLYCIPETVVSPGNSCASATDKGQGTLGMEDVSGGGQKALGPFPLALKKL